MRQPLFEKDIGFSTRAIHDGGGDGGDLTPPIHQTSTFILGKSSYVYTRAGNPTQGILERKMASLERGESCVAFSSGMATISAVMLSSMHKGDHFISTDVLYGGTYSLFVDLKRLGIEVSFVDTSRTEEVRDAIGDKTKLVFLETPANPTMKISDIRGISKIAKEKNEDIKIVVDNTFMSPYFQQPLKLGADIVVHSATKYLCGHGDALGGIAVGDEKSVENIRKILVHYGGVISPFNAWLIIRGLKTLALRMKRHEENAVEVAKFLEEHVKIKRVLYPGLDTFPYFGIAKRQMHGCGGMLSFELCSEEDVYSMLQGVKICKLAVSLGTAETLIEHPYSMTHLNFPKKESLGISKRLIRLSVGLEDVDDIMDDLKHALS